MVEVVLSAQFASLERLTAPHMGLLWQTFRSEFPIAEQQSPVEHITETFNTAKPLKPSINFQVLAAPPTPRCFFRNEDRTQILQVQSDRFTHNWTKTCDQDRYPRYEVIRQRFQTELTAFANFIKLENLGQLFFEQCEVTYVNYIESGPGWKDMKNLNQVLTLWTGVNQSKYLGEPEDISFSQKHLIKDDATGDPVGRLHIDLESGYSPFDLSARALRLTLTSRLRPTTPDIEGVLNRIDLGRYWIVQSFSDLCTEEMKKLWGQTNES